MNDPLHRLRHGCARVLGLALASSGLAVAQSGSESFTALGPELLPAAGASASANFTSEARLSAPPSGLVAVSANFQAVGPLAFVVDLTGIEQPLLFAVGPPQIKAGAQPTVTLSGQNFDESGAGAATVQFGDEPPVPVNVLNATTATATAPAGYDANTNPKARVDVTYVNGIGSSTLPGGAVFTPAIEVVDPAEVGGTTTIRYSDNPGDILALFFSNAQSQVPIPLSGYVGAITIQAPGTFVQNIPCGPSGSTDAVVGLPNNPALAGAIFFLQGIGVDAGGTAFRLSNEAALLILP